MNKYDAKERKCNASDNLIIRKTERETSPESIVLHKSLLIVGVSRVLEELIVLLNQRNKFLAGYHSYLPSAYEER